MKLNTVIFDMDGLLIDSEPCWEEAGKITLSEYDLDLSSDEYASTIGLRTKEWIDWWFRKYKVDAAHAPEAERTILENAIRIIDEKGQPLPGVNEVIELFRKHDFKIGIATSSPIALVDVVAKKLGITELIQAVSSAENLVHGKPHPEVYLDCARALDSSPLQCICFEDSVNGMIAAKAARMACIVVPAAIHRNYKQFNLADVQLNSLLEFDENLLANIMRR
jgi:HAD superfamily hydrolase (TIGR01509 family)